MIFTILVNTSIYKKRDTIITLLVHFNDNFNSLNKIVSINICKNEINFIKIFQTLARYLIHTSGERIPHTCKKTRFFCKSTTITSDSKYIYLKTVIIVKFKWFILIQTLVMFETYNYKSVS